MTQNALKQGALDSLVAMSLFVFLPCMGGLGFQNDAPRVWKNFRAKNVPYIIFGQKNIPGGLLG